MSRIINKKFVRDYLLIIVGTTLLAVSISMFFDPLSMVIGGVTGLAIIIKGSTEVFVEGGIPIFITNLVINIPLFLLAVFLKGKDYGGKTLFSTVYLSFALYFTRYLPVLTEDLLLGCIFGAVISGVGLGLVFLANATTGGTDLAAALLQMIFKHHSIARIMMVLDGIIIMVGFLVFGAEKTMYAIIAIYITAQVVDAILEGIHFSKAALIISDQEDEIAQEIYRRLDRGITTLKGAGKYTANEKDLLLCVVGKKEIVTVKEIVKNIDPKAFVIVSDVREVLGEGFIEYQQGN